MVLKQKKSFNKQKPIATSVSLRVSASFNSKSEYESAIEGNYELTRDHVEKLSALVNASSIATKIALLIIDKNKGYKAFGFESFKDYVKKTLKISYDAALKQLWAARVAYCMGGRDAIGRFSDNSMLPMKGLDNDQIDNVKKALKKKHGQQLISEYKCTRTMVEDAMRSLGLLVDDDSEPLDIATDKFADDEFTFEDTENNSETEMVVKAGKKSAPSQEAQQQNSSQFSNNLSNNQRQFLAQFNAETAKSKSIKAVFDAFVETDAGNNPDTVMRAIRHLTTHYCKLVLSIAKAPLDDEDE